MNGQNDLLQKREAIIEQIKRVFPKNPPSKKKLKLTKKIPASVGGENRRLEAMLDGKTWIDVIGDSSLVYNLTDVDHLMVITDDAYCYYLPALLATTLKRPNNEALYGLYHKLETVISRFSVEQVDVVIEYFEFQARLASKEFSQRRSEERRLQEIEDYLLHLLLFRDQLSGKGKKAK